MERALTLLHLSGVDVTRLNRWTWAGIAIVLCLLAYWLLDASGVIADWTAGSTVTYTEYDGSALVSADGRTIGVGGFSYPCFGTVTLDLRESATQVGLRLKWTTPNRHGVCNMAMAEVTDLKGTLSAPLGRRSLVDAVSGRAIAWFDEGRILRPARLPPGYRLAYFAPGYGSYAGGSQSRSPRASYTEEYSAADGQQTLTIVGVVGPLAGGAPALGSQNVTVTVRGHIGQADTRSLRWMENGVSFYMSLGTADRRPPPAQVAAYLVPIADSAP